MADIRIRVKDKFIDDLKSDLDLDSYTAVLQDALTLIKWAAEERKKGRSVISADADGRNVVHLALRSLDSITPRDGLAR